MNILKINSIKELNNTYDDMVDIYKTCQKANLLDQLPEQVIKYFEYDIPFILPLEINLKDNPEYTNCINEIKTDKKIELTIDLNTLPIGTSKLVIYISK